jgi:hypothetical protein
VIRVITVYHGTFLELIATELMFLNLCGVQLGVGLVIFFITNHDGEYAEKLSGSSKKPEPENPSLDLFELVLGCGTDRTNPIIG